MSPSTDTVKYTITRQIVPNLQKQSRSFFLLGMVTNIIQSFLAVFSNEKKNYVRPVAFFGQENNIESTPET